MFLEELTPPLELLQMIGSWIQDDPRLVLITFLNTPLSGNQPISSLDVTPLGGLVRWCVKAPLAYRRDKKLALTNGTTESESEVGPLFSALHLSVLQVRGVVRYICLQYTFICSIKTPPTYTVKIIKPFPCAVVRPVPHSGLHAFAEHTK